ncbi:MAG: hypothetical protein K8R46_14575 [Pirellulales bacterium]|nr:hypothetical protein [Pirellulales bacterium]
MRWKKKKSSVVHVFSFFLLMTICGFDAQPALWSRVPGTFTESEVLAVEVKGEGQMIIGTKNALYIREEADGAWRRALGMTENIDGIVDIFIDFDTSSTIVALDKSSAYQINQNSSRKVFSIKNETEEQCLAVLKSPQGFYIGTTKRLYFRASGQNNWQRMMDIGEQPVVRIRQSAGQVYVAAGSRLYRMNGDGSNITSVFRVFGVSEEESVWDDNGGSAGYPIKDMIIDSGQSGAIYLAAQTGIYHSPDQGQSWKKIPTRGFPLKDIRSLVVVRKSGEGQSGLPGLGKNILIVGTNQGAFQQNGDSWLSLYKGLETGRINDLSVGADGTLYAATDQGVYSLPIAGLMGKTGNAAVTLSYPEALKRFEEEPTIREVQQLAINYAEVDNSKIKGWRRLARQKAWLPSLSMGMDSDRNVTRSDSVYGSYTSGGQSYVGPDDKTGYSNFGFDVSLSWDLADLVWSTDQTTIDSRAKMMVELREDILNQVTRLYFERRRLQIEMINIPGRIAPDALDKQMRIEELTALIDAMTGGEFSERNTAGKQRTGSPEQAVSF